MRSLIVWLSFVCVFTRILNASHLISIQTTEKLFGGEQVAVELPLADGRVALFQVEPLNFLPSDSPYRIKTFRAASIETGCHGSLVVTPESISAQIFHADGVSYLNSTRIDANTLQLHFDSGEGRASSDYQCLSAHGAAVPPQEGMLRQQSAAHMLRTFRLAPGATAEFTEHFGSKEAAVQEVITAMSRVSGIFQRELGISFQLVSGFERMIFTNKNSDPFSSNEPTEDLIKECQAAFDSVIGNANYDVGIVLTRGNFGLAYIRSVCDPARKGSSCIGLSGRSGDAFHVNLVTHELAHQFGANHTFNSPTDLCAERRNDWAAFEPGAGSTIMSYSSLPCGGDSFQAHHDAYFHSESLKEIRDFINSPAVTCGTLEPAFNLPPTVRAGDEYTIPVGTPFALTATATDPEGDAVTYCWEQRDLGPAQTLGAPDNGLSPLFRSFPPTRSPTRLFPAIERILAGTDAPEERLPRTNRVLRFRVVARDSHDHGAVSWADTQIEVRDQGGPFRITSHNAAQILSGSTRVEWSTGGSERAPVSATQVRILLSTNDGVTFSIVLAASTANDGSEEVVLPPINAANVRLKVEPVNNIFFDINDAPLTLASSETKLRLELARGAQDRLVLSWSTVPGERYRLERAGAIPPTRWSEALTTNAPGASVSVTLSTSVDAAFYRVVQD